MLTRRHIRIKVMQSLFAMKQKESVDLDTEIKFLKNSLSQARILFLVNLDLLATIRNYAEEVLIANKGKKLATPEEKNPNTKFINNPILKLIGDNSELAESIDKQKINFWHLDEEYVKILYREIVDSDLYQNYMNNEADSFKIDKHFILDIFKEIIAPNDKLFDYYEDKKLSWVDDIPLINTALVNFIKKLKASDDADLSLPSLVKDIDDLTFATDLFRKTKLSEKELAGAIEGKTPNWDQERIAKLDQIMLQLAICEFLKFPSIPVKVTINEYLEIAKEYSTSKSSIFINGILDKLSKEYKEQGSLNKIGRGLL